MGIEMARVWNGRRQKWFFIDNEIIDEFKLSPEADSLYMKLCRHANNQNGESRPSLRKWAKEKKIGWDKLKAAADELTEKKLIKIIKEEHGRPKIYVIMDAKGDSTVELPPQASDSTSETPQGHRDSASKQPTPQGDSTSEHELNSIQNVKKTTKAPEVDPQESPPAHEEVYDHIYQGETQEPGAASTPPKKEQGYSFEKKPNLEGAAIFKRMAKFGASDDGESADSNPGYKLNCMKCGFLTEFENRDAAVDGKCKNCGEPIFSEEEKVK